jgi:hypothetical protein
LVMNPATGLYFANLLNGDLWGLEPWLTCLKRNPLRTFTVAGRNPKATIQRIFWRTSNLRPCNMKRHGNQFFYSANSGISVLVVFGWGMYHFWPLTFGLWDMRVLMGYDRRSPLSTNHTT